MPDLNELDLDKNRARLEEITLREEDAFLNVDELGMDDDQVKKINHNLNSKAEVLELQLYF